MKKHLIYKFPKNKAHVKLSWEAMNPKNKRYGDDCYWLEWRTQEGENLGIGMRPDEALLIAEMLVKGVRLTTETYNCSKPIKGYRIK